MVVLSYEEPRPAKPDRFTMPLRGFRAQAYRDGSVRYGGEAGCTFCFDGSLSPRPNAKGKALSATRSPGLVDLILRLDQACKVRIRGGHLIGSIPQLPRILLGFAPDQPPQFEDSIALRRKAARRLADTCGSIPRITVIWRNWPISCRNSCAAFVLTSPGRCRMPRTDGGASVETIRRARGCELLLPVLSGILPRRLCPRPDGDIQQPFID
jgi:hypothetical protein